jgi:hypothetical protein
LDIIVTIVSKFPDTMQQYGLLKKRAALPFFKPAQNTASVVLIQSIAAKF